MRSAPDPLAPGLAQLGTVAPLLANAVKRALAVREEERPQSIAELRYLIWPSSASTINLGSQQAEQKWSASDTDLPPKNGSAFRVGFVKGGSDAEEEVH